MTPELPIVFEDAEGLVFYMPHLIASLTMELPGRCRGVMVDGSVAYRDSLPQGSWVAHHASWVLPHLREQTDSQGFPARPSPGPGAPSPFRALRKLPQGRSAWVRDDGEEVVDAPADSMVATHPELVSVRTDFWLNRQRIRRLVVDKRFNCRIMGDDGTQLAYTSKSGLTGFTERLGLPSPSRFKPTIAGTSPIFLRDWPFELATSEGELLRRTFKTANDLMGNQIYQVFRYRAQGIVRKYGDSHAGLFYNPMDAALFRAGYLSASSGANSREVLRQRFVELVDAMVNRGLFDLRKLGFRDTTAHLRRIGHTRPQVVLLVEKESLQPAAELLSEEFGISYLVTGGTPKLNSTEFFVDSLRRVHAGDIEVKPLVDFDAKGWLAADAFVGQLERYAMGVSSPLDFLVRAEDFTAEERALFAMPLSTGSPEAETVVRKWFERTGGTDGRPWGIHANLLPFERLRSRLMSSLCL